MTGQFRDNGGNSKLTPEDIVLKWRDRSTLSINQLRDVGMDCLDFVATNLEAGNTIGVKLKGSDEFTPFNIKIPGLTTET